MKRILSLVLALMMSLSLMSFTTVSNAEVEGLSEFAGMDPIDVTIAYWQFTDPKRRI